MLGKVYIGCYEDKAEARDLTHHALTDAGYMTAFKCISTCRDLGFKYAGLQVSTTLQ